MNYALAAAAACALAAAAAPYPAAADADGELVSFAGALEEALGHLRALELNLDEGDAELAATHATHPIAELYGLIKPQLAGAGGDLDERLRGALDGLAAGASTSVPREQAQQAIDDTREIIEEARLAVVGGELSSDPGFRAKLAAGLLETSAAEYAEAVSMGRITEPAEYQDGSAFVWRSEQIVGTLGDHLGSGAADARAHYAEIWGLYDARADASDVASVTGELVGLLDPGRATGDEVLLDHVAAIRDLLEQARQAYAAGDSDEALSLATSAYLDHYEFLEHPLVELGERDLMEDVEVMLREDLRALIRDGAPAAELGAHIDAILERMDEIAAIVPEFGLLALAVMAAATMAAVVAASRSQILARA